MSSEYVLQMQNICKSFPGVKALEHVDLNLRVGSVHALLGENGAGKSTLMKILAGIYTADSGEILIQGQSVRIHSVDDAKRAGIVMIHQELSGAANLTVTENIYLNEELKGTLGFIDRKAMRRNVEQFLEKYNLHISPDEKYGNLSVAQMQMVEIAKAVSHEARVIIFDEPTSSLSDKEVDFLFKVMNQLRDKGVAMIYISHKMDEIKRIADDITVMRDGTYVGTWPAAEMSTDDIIAKMVGRELTKVYPDHVHEIGDVILEAEHLSSIHAKSFQDCSFNIRKGEILGFGGLVGAQRTELMEGLFGIRHLSSGTIKMHGKEVKIKRSRDAMDAGLGMITEDRRGNGIFGCLSIKDNTGISIYNKHLKAGFILDHPTINKIVDDSIKQLSIKTPSMQQHIENLSGGNQQKVVIGKWVNTDVEIFIFDEPTRGIDVGAKREIYSIINELAAQGKAVIFISSEMAELLGMCDRIYVMNEGKIVGELDRPQFSQEAVMSCIMKSSSKEGATK